MQWLAWDLNLKTRLIGETLYNALFWMYFPFMALYFSDAFGNGIAGMLMTVPPVISMIGNLVGGQLCDRLGRRPIMLTGAFMQTSMFALFSVSASHWLDYAAYIGIGLGGSIYGPASSAMVADLTPENERRRVFATFVTAANIGAVFGPAVGAFLFFHYRSELLWTCTGVSLLYCAAIFIIVRETLPEPAGVMKTQDGAVAILKRQWCSYTIIFRDKLFAIYVAAGVLVMIAFSQLDLYLALYVNKYVPAQTLFAWDDWSLKLESAEIFGWMVGLSGLLYVGGLLPFTKWFEHWSDRNTLILSSLLFGMGMFLVGLTTNVWLLFGFMTILTVGEMIRSPVAQSFVSKYAPSGARGQYMGAAGLQVTAGRLFAPFTIVLSSWMPPVGVFGIILLCTLLSCVLYMWLFRRMSTRGPRSSSPFGQ